MKQAAIFLILLIGKAAGMEATELKGTVSRVEGDFGIRIEYDTEYEAKLGVRKGHLL